MRHVVPTLCFGCTYKTNPFYLLLMLSKWVGAIPAKIQDVKFHFDKKKKKKNISPHQMIRLFNMVLPPDTLTLIPCKDVDEMDLAHHSSLNSLRDMTSLGDVYPNLS